MSKWDNLIRRLGVGNAPPQYKSARDALADAAGGKGGIAGYAQQLLTAPRASTAMDGVDSFLREYGASIGRPIGRGRESLVFAAHGPEVESVLKLQARGAGRGFPLPVGIEGVAGYYAKDRIGDDLLVALQPRAAKVLPSSVRAKFGGIAEEGRWIDRADSVQRSLAARGMEWTDPHASNVGLMPDGNLAVIDGAVVPREADSPLPQSLRMSVEDALRLLRQR